MAETVIFTILWTLVVVFVVVAFCCTLWNNYRKREAKRQEQFKKNRTEFIEGWRLNITVVGQRNRLQFSHPELRNLWKVYGWYLTRDSEKYNIQSQKGYQIICRCNIVDMELEKIKLPKNDWVIQENNDETEE